MAALSFLTGFACLAPFRKKGGCRIHSAVTYMMAGLLVLNVYAEYFSLFAGVGFWATLIAITALFFGGQYDGMLVTGLVILAASGIVALTGLRRENRKGTASYRRKGL